jgi:hypothetical protein
MNIIEKIIDKILYKFGYVKIRPIAFSIPKPDIPSDHIVDVFKYMAEAQMRDALRMDSNELKREEK